MFRTLILIGSVGAFLTAALVPQDGTSARELAKIAQHQVISMGVSSSTAESIKTAATILRAVSEDPKLKAALVAAHKNIPAADIDAASKALLAMAPKPKDVVKTVVRTVVNSGSKPKASILWKRMKVEIQDPTFQLATDRIEFATKKGDVRLCIDETDASVVKSDYLVLCVARLTRDAARCEQISDTLAIPLRTLCTEELAT